MAGAGRQVFALVHRLQTELRVNTTCGASNVSFGLPNRHAVTWGGAPVVLTVTEFLLLQALAQRPGFVKTRDQLMDVAYDEDTYVDDRTIDSHIKRLRKKFRAADPDFAAIETLYGIGYRFSLPAMPDG